MGLADWLKRASLTNIGCVISRDPIVDTVYNDADLALICLVPQAMQELA